MDEKSSAGINGSDGGLAAGVASKKKEKKKKSLGCFLYYSLYSVSLWGRHAAIHVRMKECYGKTRRFEKSGWIKHPSHGVRLLNNGRRKKFNLISAFLVKEAKSGFLAPGIIKAHCYVGPGGGGSTCIKNKARAKRINPGYLISLLQS